MTKISSEIMNKIQEQALKNLDKYSKGSLYNKPNKKPQFSFFYDDETGTKKRKTLSIPDGDDPQQVKLQFITQTLIKRYELQQEQKKKQLLGEIVNKELLEKVERIADALPESKQLLNPCTKTVSQVIEEYLVDYRNTNVTYVTYHASEVYSRKIKVALGSHKIADITNEDFQHMLNTMKNNNTGGLLSNKYAKQIRVLFENLLKYAKKKGYISSYAEIIEDVKLPINLKKSNPDEKFLEYSELACVLYAIRNNLKFYTMFTILTLTGMRSQELFALRIQDIDFENNKISIRQATKMQEQVKKGDRRYDIGTTKTEHSVRYVPAINSVLKLLKNWIDFTEKEGIRERARAKGNEGIIFTNNLGDIIHRDSLLKNIEDYIKRTSKVDVPHMTFHMCRHCFATYLHREGCSLEVIQQCMGHTTKKGSVTQIHYIAPSHDYVEKALPYLENVELKLIEACSGVMNK